MKACSSSPHGECDHDGETLAAAQAKAQHLDARAQEIVVLETQLPMLPVDQVSVGRMLALAQPRLWCEDTVHSQGTQGNKQAVVTQREPRAGRGRDNVPGPARLWRSFERR